MLDGAVDEDGDVGGSAADIHQGDSQLLLLCGENRFRRSKLFQDDIRHVQIPPVARLDDVLGAGHGSRDDMHPRLQTDPAHPQRLANPVLVINDELLGENVNYLAIHGDGDGLGGVNDPFHVLRGNLAVLDGDDPLGVEPLDVSPRDSGVDRLDLAPRHELRLFHRLSDGGNRALDIDHYPLAEPPRRACSNADDVDSFFGDIPDDGAYFGRPDIEANNEIIFSGSGHCNSC